MKKDKVLIVHAHPEPKSFCSALKFTAERFFKEAGTEVRVTDLYAQGFDPVGGEGDFNGLSNSGFFKYQLEQVHAFRNDGFVPALQKHMDDLVWCDVLVFNFPLWWFGLPAILKGWVDRVFAMGFTYGDGKGVYDNGVFKEKTAFLSFTTGGPEIAYNGGKNGDLDTILFPIQHGMLYFVGMTVLPPFIGFGPARKSQEEREMELGRYREWLANIENHKPIYTNR